MSDNYDFRSIDVIAIVGFGVAEADSFDVCSVFAAVATDKFDMFLGFVAVESHNFVEYLAKLEQSLVHSIHIVAILYGFDRSLCVVVLRPHICTCIWRF